MTDKPITERRRTSIEALRERVEQLRVSGADDSVKAEGTEALRDLREAEAWLDVADSDPQRQAAVLGFADYRMLLAQHRLDFIDEKTRTLGPGWKFYR